MTDVDNSLEAYQVLILNANKTLNLVSRRNVGKLLPGLITESLIPLNWKSCNIASPLLDIGCGGGFPGIPLKLSSPHISLTLLDANRKKILFLKSVIQKLQLTDTSAVWSRHEEFAGQNENRQRYNTITARGVGDFPLLIQSAGTLLKPHGELIVWLSGEPEYPSEFFNYFHLPEILQYQPGLILLKAEKV